MPYLPVKDLKKSKDLWRRLKIDNEIIITRDGQPCAILVGVEPDQTEQTLAEIRRSLFSAAIARVRERAAENPPAAGVVEKAISESRRA